jgi:hypothetical protein
MNRISPPAGVHASPVAGNPWNAGTQRDVVLETRGAQNPLDIHDVDGHARRLARGNGHGHIAQQGADLSFQAPHPGLTSVVGDDFAQCVLGDLHLDARESVCLQLPFQQVAARDLQFLLLGIAGQLDDFHAVAQRPGNGVEHVRGADEQDLRQVEGNAKIVVAKAVVLLGVEHFEQRGKRIALIAGRQLVDFVQHEHRIAPAGLSHGLRNVAGQRADVGAPVSADFRFVMHTAETYAAELESQRLRNALAQ